MIITRNTKSSMIMMECSDSLLLAVLAGAAPGPRWCMIVYSINDMRTKSDGTADTAYMYHISSVVSGLLCLLSSY